MSDVERADLNNVAVGEMFSNVIIGIDGREGGHDAVALARQMVSSGGRLALAHVFFLDPAAPFWAPPVEQSTQRERALKRLTAQDATGLDGEVLSVAARSVGEGLRELALSHHAGLLVIGACGRGLLGRVAIGDDARTVLDQAPCPVAVAPAGYAASSATLRAIDVAYDGSPESDRALAIAREFAAAHNAELSLSDHPLGDLASDAGSVELLVVGLPGHGRLSRFLHPGISRIARVAPCPLLVVPDAITLNPAAT